MRAESSTVWSTLQITFPCSNLAADSLEEQPLGCSLMHCCCAALRTGGDSLFGCLWECAGQPAAQPSLPCCTLADCSITKFLNRILGLEVDKQNMLFQYFSDTFDYLIEKDKKEGKYDMGILGKEERGDQTSYTAPLRFPAPPCADHWLFLCPHRLLKVLEGPSPT